MLVKLMTRYNLKRQHSSIALAVSSANNELNVYKNTRREVSFKPIMPQIMQ